MDFCGVDVGMKSAHSFVRGEWLPNPKLSFQPCSSNNTFLTAKAWTASTSVDLLTAIDARRNTTLAMIDYPADVSELLYAIDQVLYPLAAQNWFIFYTLRFWQSHGSYLSTKVAKVVTESYLICHCLSRCRLYEAYFGLPESP